MTVNTDGIRKLRSTAALIDAYVRLRDGKGTATDGELTVTSVAREAGVSRATAYRCAELLAMFDRYPTPAKPKPKMVSGSAELRATVGRLLNRIVILEAILTDRENQIRHLRSTLWQVDPGQPEISDDMISAATAGNAVPITTMSGT